MTFNDVLSQTIAMLQLHSQVFYRTLKGQFAVDDAVLEDLKYGLIEVQQRALDHDGAVLVRSRPAPSRRLPSSCIAPWRWHSG